ncbi:MAG: hypothetical protein DRN27_08055, partial [Thermoplasmata archaeon]
VLGRNNKLFNSYIETQFRENNIPYQMVSAYSFFMKKEIRAIIGLMKFLYNQDHIEGLLEFGQFFKLGFTPKRFAYINKPINKNNVCKQFEKEFPGSKNKQKWHENLLKITSFMHNDIPEIDEINECLKNIDAYSTLQKIDKKEESDRLTNAYILIHEILPRYDTIEKALLHITLSSERDVETKNDQVRLMTIHAAKGLEWPIVYMIGLEEGILPSVQSIAEEGDDESERRVFFVGMSRAKKILNLHSTMKRRFPQGYLKSSRFIKEIGI